MALDDSSVKRFNARDEKYLDAYTYIFIQARGC